MKQAPRAWYREIDSYFGQCGFKKSTSEATLYAKSTDGAEILRVSIYVDDIIYTGSSQNLIKEMTNLGLLHHFLGTGVTQTEASIFIHQRKYASSLFKRFGLLHCKPMNTPLVPSDKLRKEDDSGAAEKLNIERLLVACYTLMQQGQTYVCCLFAS